MKEENEVEGGREEAAEQKPGSRMGSSGSQVLHLSHLLCN